MALIHRPPDVVFHWPDPAVLDPAAILLAYNPLADELTVAFGGTVRAGVVDSLDWTTADYVALRLDFDTNEVVGIQLDHARRVAAVEHPAWQPVIDAAPSEPGVRRADPSVWPALTAFVADVMTLSRS